MRRVMVAACSLTMLIVSVVSAPRSALASGCNVGTNGDDYFVGTPAADYYCGLGGNDTILGMGGNDFLYGNSGDDYIDGGSGQDWVGYNDNYTQTHGVHVDLRSGTATGDGTDTIVSVANVMGSDYADVIDGNKHANTLYGGGGNDDVAGHQRDDSLQGSVGNDTLYPGTGTDGVYGDDGRDTVDYYFDAPGPLSIDLASGSATGTDVQDTLDGIENVNGSRFGDTIIGTGKKNVIRGLDGNDDLRGAGGDDSLDGDGGNDNLHGGNGFDTCIQGSGTGMRVGCEA
jgi:Ca2+-binding RTX toxin-like protein